MWELKLNKMPNKNTPNGFYMFMLEEQKKIKAQTKRAPSMHEMPAMCKDTWKSLSAAEKEHYDRLAKQEKARQRGGSEKDKYRKDNQRQIIAYRRDPVVEKEKRRRHETDILMKNWLNEDSLDMKFHVIDFQVLYDERTEDHYMPVELGMVSFTLRKGLIKSLHTFINPGPIPQGNRGMAFRHSENTHKIPVDYEKGDKNYQEIWTKIKNFVEEDQSDSDEIPPLFTLSDNTEIVESCLDFIHTLSDVNEPNLLHKIFCMEDLVASLIIKSGTMDRRPVLSQIHDALKQNIWDYTSSIRCSFHEETDCSHCSISIVKRYCFAAFDLLTNVLGFDLTKNHMPEEPDQEFQVIAPEVFSRSFASGNARREAHQQGPRTGGWGEADRSPSPFRTPRAQPEPHQMGLAPSYVRSQPAQSSTAWLPPSVGRFEITLSDDEDDADDDEYEALHSQEVRSTSDQYQLKELRKPKTPSMFLEANIPPMAALGRGLARGRGVQAPPPIGRVQPTFTARPVGVAPPPGFSNMGPPNPMSMAAQIPTAQSLGRGIRPGMSRGRGRGLPPQV